MVVGLMLCTRGEEGSEGGATALAIAIACPDAAAPGREQPGEAPAGEASEAKAGEAAPAPKADGEDDFGGSLDWARARGGG